MKVYVGYDTREDIAYQVCEHSIYTHSTRSGSDAISINKQLRKDKWYWRELDKLASTEFTFTRFLIPALENYKGWALFCDSDIVFMKDIKELFDCVDNKYAVMCVQHDYTPKAWN
jgi:lipopolysaccharide biosynthesis glycosyltransferase